MSQIPVRCDALDAAWEAAHKGALFCWNARVECADLDWGRAVEILDRGRVAILGEELPLLNWNKVVDTLSKLIGQQADIEVVAGALANDSFVSFAGITRLSYHQIVPELLHRFQCTLDECLTRAYGPPAGPVVAENNRKIATAEQNRALAKATTHCVQEFARGQDWPEFLEKIRGEHARAVAKVAQRSASDEDPGQPPRKLSHTEKKILRHCRRRPHKGSRIAAHICRTHDYTRRLLARLVKEKRLRKTGDGYRADVTVT